MYIRDWRATKLGVGNQESADVLTRGHGLPCHANVCRMVSLPALAHCEGVA